MEKAVATRSIALAWRTPGTGEPGALPSVASHRIGHDSSDLAAAAAAVWGKHHEKHFVWLYHLRLLINVRAGYFYIFTLRDEKTEAQRLRDLLKPQT